MAKRSAGRKSAAKKTTRTSAPRASRTSRPKRPTQSQHQPLDRLVERLDELLVGVNQIVARLNDGLALHDGAHRPPVITSDVASLQPGAAYHLSQGRFVPFSVAHIRPADDFYGYLEEKRLFSRHFADFAQGQSVPPLLISGLPGLGKTHFAIAHTVVHPELTLVTADERYLVSGFDDLLSRLGTHEERRIVLFFDDVNAERLDWTAFRNQIGGFLPTPQNVAIVIASNYQFPGPVRSRCVIHEFRPMNVAVCREMIAGYFQRHLEITQPRRELLDVTVADFVNEYVNGPLDELTPRSLIRYLDLLAHDEARRQRLLDESLGETIPAPDEEMFDKSNKRVQEQMERRGQWESVRKVEPSV